MGEVRERDPGASRVMSIETGFSCNAYCAFCPQLNYRGEVDPEDPIDLTTDDIRARIRHGAEQGYKQIGFSGGECTIRPDFIELIAYAKTQGYELIGVTTNGMMMSYMSYAAKIIRAGLNSINISVHGHTAELHDGMMRTPGSFELAIKAIRNVQEIREKTGLRIEMMSMMLASPQVIDTFPEQVRLMGSLGVKLHMIQPFLLTKGNTPMARRYLLPSYERIEKAIREASAVAQGHGGHIKLFNTPVCMFWDIEDRLERQWKKLDVFREHEHSRPGELQRHVSEGYYRVEDCATCPEPCNGFRAEYYPQAQAKAELLSSIAAHQRRYGDGDLWLGGLEMFDPGTLGDVLEDARRRVKGRLVMLTGAIGRSYLEQYELAVKARVDEICFVAHRQQPGTDDRRDRHNGNFEDIAKGLKRLERMAGSHRPVVSTTAMPFEIMDHQADLEVLREMGLRRLLIGESQDGVFDRRAWWRSARLASAMRHISESLDFEVVLLGDEKVGAAPFEVVDPLPRYLRHRRESPEFYWITWSLPAWARVPKPKSGTGYIHDFPDAPPEPELELAFS